jgi:Spy/CpxP family protein refolding chaperone
MRTMTRIFAATMLLLTACTALSLSVQSAMAFPPSPCDEVDDFDGF